MNISVTDLFDQNAGMICANVRLRCSMGITSIDVFDQNVGMAFAKTRFKCSSKSLVLIYLINMWVRNVPKLDSDDHGNH